MTLMDQIQQRRADKALRQHTAKQSYADFEPQDNVPDSELADYEPSELEPAAHDATESNPDSE